MRAKVQDVLDWCDAQIDNPTPTPPAKTWRNLCLSFSRRAWGLVAFALSAKLAWAMVPAKYKHHTTPDKVPAGAMCYGLMNSKSGHVWIAGRGKLNRRIGFSTDYRHIGQVSRAPLNLPDWTHDPRVWWTAWSPFGFLPLWKDAWNKRLIAMPAVYKGKGIG